VTAMTRSTRCSARSLARLPRSSARRRPRTRAAETSSITESNPKLVRASEPAMRPAVTATPASISIHPIENCSRRMARRCSPGPGSAPGTLAMPVMGRHRRPSAGHRGCDRPARWCGRGPTAAASCLIIQRGPGPGFAGPLPGAHYRVAGSGIGGCAMRPGSVAPSARSGLYPMLSITPRICAWYRRSVSVTRPVRLPKISADR
jgi:hypothetical protein